MVTAITVKATLDLLSHDPGVHAVSTLGDFMLAATKALLTKHPASAVKVLSSPAYIESDQT